jgi:uncharacterized protein involved in exopolysaccharide biosynthesis
MKEFLKEYRWWIIGPLILLVIATVVLAFLSAGPQSVPFIYQIN